MKNIDQILQIVRRKAVIAAKQCGTPVPPFNYTVSILEDPEDHLADDAFTSYLATLISADLEALIADRERLAVEKRLHKLLEDGSQFSHDYSEAEFRQIILRHIAELTSVAELSTEGEK